MVCNMIHPLGCFCTPFAWVQSITFRVYFYTFRWGVFVTPAGYRVYLHPRVCNVIHLFGCTFTPFTFTRYVTCADQMLRNGEVEMQARDEELRFLRMQLAEDKRTLSLMQRTLPSKKAMEHEIVSLQIEVFYHSQLGTDHNCNKTCNKTYDNT